MVGEQFRIFKQYKLMEWQEIELRCDVHGGVIKHLSSSHLLYWNKRVLNGACVNWFPYKAIIGFPGRRDWGRYYPDFGQPFKSVTTFYACLASCSSFPESQVVLFIMSFWCIDRIFSLVITCVEKNCETLPGNGKWASLTQLTWVRLAWWYDACIFDVQSLKCFTITSHILSHERGVYLTVCVCLFSASPCLYCYLSEDIHWHHAFQSPLH